MDCVLLVLFIKAICSIACFSPKNDGSGRFRGKNTFDFQMWGCVRRSLGEPEEHQIRWNLSYRWCKLLCGCWKPNVGPLKELPVLSNAGPAPLHFNLYVCKHICLCMYVHTCENTCWAMWGYSWVSSLGMPSTPFLGRSHLLRAHQLGFTTEPYGGWILVCTFLWNTSCSSPPFSLT